MRPLHYEEWQRPKLWYGGVGDRIGFLTPKQEDAWWQVSVVTSEALLTAEIVDVLHQIALPFLRQFQSQSDIDEYQRQLISRGPMNYGLALLAFCMAVRNGQSAEEIEKHTEMVRQFGRVETVPRETLERLIKRVLQSVK